MATPVLSRAPRPSTMGKCPKGQTSTQVVLERVLGFTSSNNCSLSLDLNSGLVSYAAGCVIVLRSFDSDRQQFIQSASKKPITAIEFSSDGKYVATGESGHQPMVRVWSVLERSQSAEYAGHHFRVIAVRFSPSARYLISLGSQEDNTLYVWDRSSGQRIASAKVTNKINGLAFSPAGQFFVTVGVRHVRYWYLETKRSRNKETIPLNGRNAILGDLFNNTFMDVCCTRHTCKENAVQSPKSESRLSHDDPESDALVLVVSKAGQLMQFSEQRCLDKWVELKVPQATCLSVHESWVAVGCSSATCLIFDSQSLQFLARLPLPHQLGSEVQLLSQTPRFPESPCATVDSALFADFLAVKLDLPRRRVICFYADHSIYVWNLADLSNLRLECAHSYHSRGVWSVDCLSDASQLDVLKHSCATMDSLLPSWWADSTFVTCADDGTTRFWDLEDYVESRGFPDEDAESPQRSKERLRRVIFTDPTHKYLCVNGIPSAGVGPVGGPPTNFPCSGQGDSAAPSPTSPTVPNAAGSLLRGPKNSISSDGCCVRTAAISPDCKHLALGDREGNLRIYDLTTMEQIRQISAHDSEILSLNFFRSDTVPELTLLCSASRDRLIHIFDPNQNYSLVQTIADHSAAIFAARIIETEEDGEIRLVSCGMDKSLLIRVLEPDDAGLTARFALEHHLVGKYSQLDAAFTPSITLVNSENKQCPRKRFLAVACQDRRLRIYNVATGRQVRCYRGSFNEDGCLLRCAVDPTGSIAATSGSDKQMNLFHLLSGEHIATLFGHSELSLGLRFLPDLRHLITVSSDSCVFVWRFSPSLTQHLLDRVHASKRFGSCGRLSAPPSAPHSVVPFRLPPSYRSRQSHSTEEFMNSSPDLNLFDSDRTDIGDEDSESDLIGVEIDRSLSRGSPWPASTDRIDNPPASSFLPGSYDSTSERNHSEETQSSSQSAQGNRPAFYFSASALPAWARRKLIATPPEKENSAEHSQPSFSGMDIVPVKADKRATCTCDTSPVRRTALSSNRLSPTSVDSSSEARSIYHSPVPYGKPVHPAKEENLMSRSTYHRRETCSRPMQFTDSRNYRLRPARTAVSRDASPCSVAASAPSTPLRRGRLSTEFESSRRSLRQPYVHTPTHCFLDRGGSGSLRSQSTRTTRCCGFFKNNTSVGDSQETALVASRKADFPCSSNEKTSEDHVPPSFTSSQSSPHFPRPLTPRSFTQSRSSVELMSSRVTSVPNQFPDRALESARYLTFPATDQLVHNDPRMKQLATQGSSKQILEGRSLRTEISCASEQPHSSEFSLTELRTFSPPVYFENALNDANASCIFSSPETATNKAPYWTVSGHSPSLYQAAEKHPLIHPAESHRNDRGLSCGIPLSNSSHFDPLVSAPGENSCDTLCQHGIRPSDSRDQSPYPLSSQPTRARWSPIPFSPDETPECDKVLGRSITDSACSSSNRPTRPCELIISRPSILALEMGNVKTSHAPSKIEASVSERTTVTTSRLCSEGTYFSSNPHRLETGSYSSSNSAGPDRFQSAREALKSVQRTLDTAIQRCIELDACRFKNDEVNALRSLITDELEWRFTQLRAMLGLQPVCVDPPVARALLADIVERLIPELRASGQGTRSEAISQDISEASTVRDSESTIPSGQTNNVDWVVDSTTELSTTTGSNTELDQPDVDVFCLHSTPVDISSQPCDDI
ncbi:unnamed protein product [Dicrocoelium dendriticum]|nr:unnamed protein product [Dicrocoelium dendriticum]